MPQHPSATHRLSALAQAHKRLERAHRQLADSFNELPTIRDLTLTAPPEPVEVELTAATNYQWTQPLGNYFYPNPEGATIAYQINPTTNPTGFTATISGSQLAIAASQSYSDHTDVIVAATATYEGQTATATATFRFTRADAAVTIQTEGANPATIALDQPSYVTLEDMRRHFNATPSSATIAYQITSPPTHPHLTATLTNWELRIANSSGYGWNGNQIIAVRATATHNGQTAQATKVFRVTTERPGATLAITATPGAQTGTLTEGATTDTYASPLPIAQYFQVQTTLDGTPSIVYAVTTEQYPLNGTIIQAALPGADLARFLSVTDSTGGYNGTRNVIVTATATLGDQLATATKTFTLNSPTPPGRPTIRINNPTRATRLDPTNNWATTELLATPGNPSYTPATATLTFQVHSNHNLTTDPKVWLTGNTTIANPADTRLPFPTQSYSAPPRVNIQALNGADSDWPDSPRNVIVRATATSGGQTAHADITYPVTYTRLIVTTRTPTPELELTPGQSTTIDVRDYFNINAGPGEVPPVTFTTAWGTAGANGITLTTIGTRQLRLTAPITAANTNTTLAVTLTTTHETESVTRTATIPIAVGQRPLILARAIPTAQTNVNVRLNSTNQYAQVFILPPGTSSLWTVTPATAQLEFDITPTIPLLTATIYSGSFILANYGSYGWNGSVPVTLTCTAVLGDSTATDSYTFHVTTTKPTLSG